MLINHFCVKKTSDLTVQRTWFNESEQRGYIQFNKPVTTANASLSLNLKVDVFDFDNNIFLDYRDLNLSLISDSTVLRVDLRFLRSIYNSKIKIVQTSEKSVLYNDEIYMDVNQEMTVEDVRFIATDVPNMLMAHEKQIQAIAWIGMVVTVVFGTVAHPWAGTLMMRTISLFSTLSNMNGNYLHISDAFFDVVSNLSSPFQFDRIIEKDQSTTRCKPAANFQKRRNAYTSCNILDLSVDSILTFLTGSLVPLLIYVFYVVKIYSHRRRQKQEEAYIASSSVILLSLANSFFGPRLLVLVFEAASPTFLKYSILTVTSTDKSRRMMIGSGLGWALLAGHMLLQFMLFNFTYNFLDLQYLKQLKFLPKKKPAEDRHLEPLIVNRVHPKKDQPIIRRPLQKAENKLPEISREAEDRSLGLASKEVSGMDPVVFEPIVLQQVLSVDTRKAAYSIMSCFIERYKKSSLTKTYQIFYYLALFEVAQSAASQFVLVRFSGDGIIQIYLIALFELLVSAFTLIANPFQLAYDLVLYATYKLLVLAVYSLKMLNFANLEEQATRQDKLDKAVLFVGVALLSYSIIVGVGSIAFGIKTLFQYQKLKKEQLALFELDKKDLIANMLHDSTVIPVKTNIPQPRVPERPKSLQIQAADASVSDCLKLESLRDPEQHKRSTGSDEGLVDSKEEHSEQKNPSPTLSVTNTKQKRALRMVMEKNESKRVLHSNQQLDIPSIALDEENDPKNQQPSEPALNKAVSDSFVSDADQLNKSQNGLKDESFENNRVTFSKLKNLRKKPFGQLLSTSPTQKPDKFANMLNQSSNITATGSPDSPRRWEGSQHAGLLLQRKNPEP